MKILVVNRKAFYLGKNVRSRSIEHRIIYPLSKLAERGRVKYTLLDEEEIPLCKSFLRQFSLVVFCRHYSDLSLRIHKFLRSHQIPTLFDVDDLVDRTLPHFYSEDNQKKVKSFLEHFSLASFITVENENLKNHMKLVDSLVLPNFIDLKDFDLKLERGRLKTRMSLVNAAKLKVGSFKDGWLEAISYYEAKTDFELHLLVDNKQEMGKFKKAVFHEPSSWYEHLFKLSMESIDVGLVPLGGDEDSEVKIFNECKSPIKYLNYTAIGAIGIYSNVPPYNRVIKNKVNGLLVENTKKAWMEAIKFIKENPKEVDLMLENARKNIEEAFGSTKSLHVWERIFRSVS